ncbi:glycosyltransferase family 9 protein [Spongiactinospora sp. TRM90649]|uniref:glycosyltransferase family 9 protein n=1 Tax=Spongiactinospora sp. TRM90649 TaxID=3031114 RepID=UPI0023F90F91|nr:glycosyltransferase family 9 protein [Spongiactinospora sp. TRM90649]MDF5753195.1 glycosyltransferase family 9 protein [Spongiactinospora sp. TRM90649]
MRLVVDTPGHSLHVRPSGSDGPSGPCALVLCGDGLGALLAAVPALRALRGSGQRVLLAARPELAELAALTGAVERFVPLHPGRPLTLAGGPPDLAVNLRDADPGTHRMLLDLRPADLWGHRSGGTDGFTGPEWDEDVADDALRWCRLLEWYGVAADPGNIALPIPLCRNQAKGAVVVHPGQGGRFRHSAYSAHAAHSGRSGRSAHHGDRGRRPEHRFALVADVVAGKGGQVVVTGGRSDRLVATRVAAQSFLPPHAVLTGRTSMRQLCAVVAGARLVVCGSAGIARLAEAYGTPCLRVDDPATSVDGVLEAALTLLAGHESTRAGYGTLSAVRQRRWR